MQWQNAPVRCLRRHQIWAGTFVLLSFGPSAFAAMALPGHSKVILFKQSSTSAPAVALSDVITSLVQDYQAFTLVYVSTPLLDTLRTRAAEEGIEAVVRDEYDTFYSNGMTVDARIGTAASIPGAILSPPYPSGASGAYVVQFIGPILDSWLEQTKAAGGVAVQYLPFNAWIVGASPAAMTQISKFPFVQFVDQLHSFLKPGVSTWAGPISPLQIELVNTPDVSATIQRLRAFSLTDVATSQITATELRVQGFFYTQNLKAILAEPLVFLDAPSGLPAPVPSASPIVLSVLFLVLAAVAWSRLR